MKNNDEDVVAVIIMWLTLLKIVFWICCLGVAGAVVRGILLAFGINT
jgi:hypothetical protein